ncbi:hypothetical protein DBB36_01240 [Flavobacterium sp. WLB]|uniref:hypothetical protein n=1 Tax=unclassified Flavobacterium TaxID=196869 RepID=UPI0006AB95EA|nr:MULTISPECIES: hypothetical protein [unclassified Flavobacterium]KOP38622.1 hypothetical protein AKO67_09210 [Flavobacterium sp. VMW]OWU89916.1 hypothetical protein APR43_15590 [Flavobacterium sp. NLM]PUU71809.1 hypothetical protein DBB36_01240 [Flavobacterium sp. WLB]
MQTKTQNSNSKFQSFIFGICIFLIGISSNAQCAMCRAALAGDSNIKKAEAVNDGIVFLMIIPYLLVAIIGFLIYKMYRSKKKNAV